jgi:hypothetical protein
MGMPDGGGYRVTRKSNPGLPAATNKLCLSTSGGPARLPGVFWPRYRSRSDVGLSERRSRCSSHFLPPPRPQMAEGYRPGTGLFFCSSLPILKACRRCRRPRQRSARHRPEANRGNERCTGGLRSSPTRAILANGQVSLLIVGGRRVDGSPGAAIRLFRSRTSMNDNGEEILVTKGEHGQNLTVNPITGPCSTASNSYFLKPEASLS